MNEDIEPDLFDALMVYDAYIEPSGTQIDMLFHAYSSYNATLNNPNMTKEIRDKMNVTDYDFLGIIEDSELTTKERAEKAIAEKENSQQNNMSEFLKHMKKTAAGN